MIIFACILISLMKLNYALERLFSTQLSTCLPVPGKRLRRLFTQRYHRTAGGGIVGAPAAFEGPA